MPVSLPEVPTKRFASLKPAAVCGVRVSDAHGYQAWTAKVLQCRQRARFRAD